MRTADIFVGSCESEFTLVLHSATELYSVGCGKEWLGDAIFLWIFLHLMCLLKLHKVAD